MLLVVQASEPWSPQTHALFPAWARERAVALLRIGYLLFVKDANRSIALFHLWIDRVMPFDVCRHVMTVVPEAYQPTQPDEGDEFDGLE